MRRSVNKFPARARPTVARIWARCDYPAVKGWIGIHARRGAARAAFSRALRATFRPVPRTILPAIFVAGMGTIGPVAATAAPQPPPEVTADTPVRAVLEEGETPEFTVIVPRAGIWMLEARESGIDAELEIRSGGEPAVLNGPVKDDWRERYLLESDGPLELAAALRVATSGTSAGEVELALSRLDTQARDGDGGERLDALRGALTAEMQAARLTATGVPESRERALDAYLQAARRYRRAGEFPAQARMLHAAAELARLLHRREQARELAARAAALYRRHDMAAPAALALALLANGLAETGDYDEARARLAEAGELASAAARDDIALTIESERCFLHLQSAALDAALPCLQRVIERAERQGERRSAATARANLGGVYSVRGQAALAIEQLRASLATWRELGDDELIAVDLGNLASQHRRLGDLQRALDYYQEALGQSRLVGNRAREARLLNNIGTVYLDLGDVHRAHQFFELSLAPRREATDVRGEIISLVNLARTARIIRDIEAAGRHVERALALARSVNYGYGELQAELARGIIAYEAGRPEAAGDSLSRAHATAAELGDRRLKALALHYLGRNAGRRGDARRARAALEEALAIQQAIADQAGTAASLTALAGLELESGEPDAALALASRAIAIVESIRTGVASRDLRATYTGSEAAAYELALHGQMQRHFAAPAAGHDLQALAIAERLRARSLVEVLSAAGTDAPVNVPEALLARRRALQQSLNEIAERRLRDPGAAPAGADASADIIAELDTLEADIARVDPRYAALGRTPNADPAALPALLEPGTALVEYFLGQRESYAWIVTASGIESLRLAAASEITAAARDAYRSLGRSGTGAGREGRAALARLGELVLEPLGDALAGSERLVVIADQILHYIPMEALPDPETGAPLIRRLPVSYLPSATALRVQRELAASRRAERTMMVLADPVFSREDPRIDGIRAASADATRGAATDLNRLPLTRSEAVAIAALVPPEERELRLGFEASRGALLGGDAHEFRILHLATHGIVDAQTPQLSGLALSMVDASGAPVEGFVGLSDIYQLRLNAELVVLSACDTALGREVRGEGLVGLTRGFMHAGAPRVVATLWQVQDRASAELMSRFYRALLIDGLGAADALRAAKLGILAERRWRQPYYWAGFVLQGDWRERREGE